MPELFQPGDLPYASEFVLECRLHLGQHSFDYRGTQITQVIASLTNSTEKSMAHSQLHCKAGGDVTLVGIADLANGDHNTHTRTNRLCFPSADFAQSGPGACVTKPMHKHKRDCLFGSVQLQQPSGTVPPEKHDCD